MPPRPDYDEKGFDLVVYDRKKQWNEYKKVMDKWKKDPDSFYYQPQTYPTSDGEIVSIWSAPKIKAKRRKKRTKTFASSWDIL